MPLNGGTSVRLNFTLLGNDDVRLFNFASSDTSSAFRISPDSHRVVYVIDRGFGGGAELISTSIDSSDGVLLNFFNFDQINSPLVFAYEISPDSQKVVFTGSQNATADASIGINSVPILGGDPNSIGPSFFSGERLGADIRISPNSQRVIFEVTNADGTEALLSQSISGDPLSVSFLTRPGEFFTIKTISPDSQRVLYLGTRTGTLELFSASISDDGPTTRLNGDLPIGSFVERDFQISENGGFVVYRADQNIFGQVELFARRLFEPPPELESFCFQVIASNGNVATICL